MSKKILLGLTTTQGSDWRAKVAECHKFGIQEIALFVTAINIEKRKELYALLEDSPVQSIPHVHLRDDMELWELEYLEKKYGVKAFNIHSKNSPHNFAGFDKNFGKYLAKTYVENMETVSEVPEKEELKNFAGLCIDFSHWQDGIMLNGEAYNQQMTEIAKEFPAGCSHVSAVSEKITKTEDVGIPGIIYENYSKHFFDDLNEFDYLKKYLEFLPELVSLELENSFADQIQAREYIEKIIQKK